MDVRWIPKGNDTRRRSLHDCTKLGRVGYNPHNYLIQMKVALGARKALWLHAN